MTQESHAEIDSRLSRQRLRLGAAGQGHLLAFWDDLDLESRDRLLRQCEELPLELLQHELATSQDPPAAGGDQGCDLDPAKVVRHDLADAPRYRAVGESIVRAGRVACFTVAGGQGTRLGWDGPKGTFPATPVSGKSLFQYFAESIAAARIRWGAPVRWYIMTSPLNHQATVDYFTQHDWFGLGESTVGLFMQGTLPSLGIDGKILMAAPDAIALNPDGHGGAVRALASSGALAQMRSHGIDTLSYFQVDNPLVHVVDPLFIGLHSAHPDSSGEVSSKVVAKRDASEKVGVFCRQGGKTQVVEYSDLPRSLAQATAADGSLLHWAGSIAIHLFSRVFLENLALDGGRLPLHRASKKVPCIDIGTGMSIDPVQPNAVKLEAFIFDAVPLAGSSLVLETMREEEFAPIKNATGEDSPATSHAAQSERAIRWLRGAGVRVDAGGDGAQATTVELSPATALEAGDLLGKAGLPRQIPLGSRVVL